MRHFLRLCSISAIHSGTCVTWLGLNGPNVPCFHTVARFVYAQTRLAPICSKNQLLAPGAPGQRPRRTAAMVSTSSCTGSCTWKLGTMSTSSSSAENSSCAGTQPNILLHRFALECKHGV